MGVFTRLKDIINSNLNAMLDAAEDPDKLIRLMIQEMEDTLVEVKANCAGAIAARKRAERAVSSAEAGTATWEERARLAIEKGREDLAREAIRERRRLEELRDAHAKEVTGCDEVVARYKEDIGAVEAKLVDARQRHRLLVQRHKRAKTHERTRGVIERVTRYDAVTKFDQLEQRIERMEAFQEIDPDLQKPSLEEAFAALKEADAIEEELARLKREPRRPAAN
jgi:phage shock protein A